VYEPPVIARVATHADADEVAETVRRLGHDLHEATLRRVFSPPRAALEKATAKDAKAPRTRRDRKVPDSGT